MGWAGWGFAKHGGSHPGKINVSLGGLRHVAIEYANAPNLPLFLN